jgi:hypothetical protein
VVHAEWCTHSCSNAVRLPIDDGIVPLSWLFRRKLREEADRLSADGRGGAQQSTHRYVKLVRTPIDDGMVPFILLVLRTLRGEADRLSEE